MVVSISYTPQNFANADVEGFKLRSADFDFFSVPACSFVLLHLSRRFLRADAGKIGIAVIARHSVAGHAVIAHLPPRRVRIVQHVHGLTAVYSSQRGCVFAFGRPDVEITARTGHFCLVQGTHLAFVIVGLTFNGFSRAAVTVDVRHAYALLHSLLNGGTERVHRHAVQTGPVQDVAMIARQLAAVQLSVIHDRQRRALREVANDGLRGRTEQRTQVRSQIDCRAHDRRLEVRFILFVVLADFKTNVAELVGIAVRTAAGQPAAIVPRERLVDRHRTIRQLADVCGCAHVQPFAVVRVAAGVLAQPSIIWLNVALQIRVIRPRAVYLYPD